jgi:hypothetical protein
MKILLILILTFSLCTADVEPYMAIERYTTIQLDPLGRVKENVYEVTVYVNRVTFQLGGERDIRVDVSRENFGLLQQYSRKYLDWEILATNTTMKVLKEIGSVTNKGRYRTENGWGNSVFITTFYFCLERRKSTNEPVDALLNVSTYSTRHTGYASSLYFTNQTAVELNNLLNVSIPKLLKEADVEGKKYSEAKAIFK